MLKRRDTEGQASGNYVYAIAALLAPPLVILVYPILGIISRNANYFSSAYAAGSSMYLAATVYLFVGVGLYISRTYSIATRLLFFIYLLSAFAWVAYSTAFELFGRHVSVFFLTAILMFVSPLALLRVEVDRVISVLGPVALILILGFAGLLTLELISMNGAVSEATEASELTEIQYKETLPNVYHLVFDEFQPEMLEHNLAQFDEDSFREFIFYPDAVTSFGRTEMALASMFGGTPYRYDRPLEQYIVESHQGPHALLPRLHKAGYVSSAHLHSARFFANQTPFNAHEYHRDVASWNDERAETSLARNIWVYTHFPSVLARKIIPEHQFDQLEGDTLLPDHDPAISMISFRDFLRKEASQSPHGRYVFVHLIVPHFPYVLDGDCNYVPGDTTGPLQQARCAMVLLEEFLDVLRQLGRFDRSLIVVHGDHGSGYLFPDGQPADMQPAGFYSESFSTARARALLLIKPTGAAGTGNHLTLSDLPATIDDVAPTILDSLGLFRAKMDERYSLLGDDVPAERRRYYHFYEKDSKTIIRGDLYRFVYEDGRAQFDAQLDVPGAS